MLLFPFLVTFCLMLGLCEHLDLWCSSLSLKDTDESGIRPRWPPKGQGSPG